MHIQVSTKLTSFTKVMYMHFKEVTSGVRVLVVGEIHDGEAPYLTYEAVLIKPSKESDIPSIMRTLKRSYALLKEQGGGQLHLTMFEKIHKAKLKPVESALGVTLVYTYARAESINGFFSTETSLIAFTGYTKNNSDYNIFIADLRVAVLAPTVKDIPSSILEKLEEVAFTKTLLFDTLRAIHYITPRYCELTGKSVEDTIIDFNFKFEEWVETPLTKQERKQLKKMYKSVI